jgi:hypothetical protein
LVSGTVLSVSSRDPAADHYLGDTIAFPRIVARFGVSDHVDVGAWGSINPRSNYGMLGVDTKVALLTQGATWPVSVSIRPSVTSLLGPSELWAANASVDVSVSRSFARISPYGGIAGSASLAVERSDDVNLDPATAQDGLVYAGVRTAARAHPVGRGREGVAGQLRVPRRHAILSSLRVRRKRDTTEICPCHGVIVSSRTPTAVEPSGLVTRTSHV